MTYWLPRSLSSKVVAGAPGTPGMLFETTDPPPEVTPYDGPYLSVDEPIPFELSDGSQHTGYRWADQHLGILLSVDTETSIIDPGRPWLVPKLVLATASNGAEHVVVLPSDVRRFLEHHRDSHLIFHNAKFDLEVLRQAIARQAVENPLLVEMADSGQIHDSRLLAMLVDIAIDDYILATKGAYALDQLCQRMLGHGPNKQDEYRTRYGELLEHDWSEPVEAGFLTYALADFDVMEAICACSGKLEHAKQFCVETNVDFDSLRAVLIRASAGCDCEVLLNAAMRLDEEQELPGDR